MITEQTWEKLEKYDGDDRIISSMEMKVLLEMQPAPKAFKSNIPTVDKLLEGFEAGELIVVSGPRKSGKTLFCQSLTYELNKQSVHPLWFSYEMTPRQFYRVFDGFGLPFFTQPLKLKANALYWVETRIAESIVKYGTGVVFIDHLHFLFDLERVRNSSIEIGTVIRTLKWMCLEYNVVIFLLCHMTKGWKNDEPGDSDIRDSSFVSQESDTGLVVYRIKGEENVSWLKVCYSRRTGVFEQKIKLKKIDGLLREESPHDEKAEDRAFCEEVRNDVYRGD